MSLTNTPHNYVIFLPYPFENYIHHKIAVQSSDINKILYCATDEQSKEKIYSGPKLLLGDRLLTHPHWQPGSSVLT